MVEGKRGAWDLQGLIEREGAVHFVESSIDLGAAGWQVVEVGLKTSVKFFDVADTHAATGGGGEAVVAIELEVDCVFEAEPFFVSEKVTPFGIAVGHCFVGTECLCLDVVSGGSGFGEEAIITL